MALDSRQKRAAVIGVGRVWYRNPHPSGLNASQRASIGQVYPVAAFSITAPTFTGTIPDISETYDTGTHNTDFTSYFTGATSYSISPSLESGWSFNASTGVLTIDTDALGYFGPFTITGINDAGSIDSNTFNISVAVIAHAPSGVNRTLSSSNKNRSLSTSNKNRIIGFSSKNRTIQ